MSLLPPPGHLRLYWWLSHFFIDNSYSPTIETMAEALGTTKSNAHRMIKELEGYGLIRTYRSRPRGTVPVPVSEFLAGLPARIGPALERPTKEDLARLIHLRKTAIKRARKKVEGRT